MSFGSEKAMTKGKFASKKKISTSEGNYWFELEIWKGTLSRSQIKTQINSFAAV